MEKRYFTITGMKNYFGDRFVEKNMCVRLVKDTKNEFDKEAIRVELDGLGLIGYVANSPRTVLGESMSAGRLYDKITDGCTANVLYILDDGVVCVLES